MNKLFFWLFFAAMMVCQKVSIYADNIIYQDDEVTVVDSTPPIQGEISSAIAREMNEIRKDEDYSFYAAGVAVRMNEAFPYLDDYVSDPNENVRSAIVDVLANETSQRSLALTVRFLRKDSAYITPTIEQIYGDYSPSQIRQWGGASLRKAVFEAAKDYPQHSASLMLAAFGSQAKPQLEAIRRLNPQRKMGFLESYLLKPVRVSFACDLALAQIGDAAALSRVKERLALGSLNDKAFLFDASKSLDTKPLLRLMLSLLSDKNEQRPLPNYGNKPQRYARICDIAWAALQVKLGKSHRMEHQPEPQTDAALQATAAQVKKKFAL